MIDEGIQIGDAVTLIWANGEEWHNAKVINQSRGNGDLWEFKFKGRIYAINLYTPRFEWMVREKGNGKERCLTPRRPTSAVKPIPEEVVL